METVKAIGSHPIDLDDGRTLAPGETAEDVPMNAHNKALLDDGFIAILGHAAAKESPAAGDAAKDHHRQTNTEGGKK